MDDTARYDAKCHIVSCHESVIPLLCGNRDDGPAFVSRTCARLRSGKRVAVSAWVRKVADGDQQITLTERDGHRAHLRARFSSSREAFPTRAWFIRLEDPLSLPQGYILQIPRLRSVLDPVWSTEDLHPNFRECETMISLKIWQLESGLAVLQERTGLALDACRRAFPTYFKTPATPSDGVDWRSHPTPCAHRSRRPT